MLQRMVWMLFDLNGRIRRRDWWLWSTFLAFLPTMICFPVYLINNGGNWEDYSNADRIWRSWKLAPFHIFEGVVFLFVTWLRICVSAKRWHDRDKSGWIGVVVEAVIMAAALPQAYYIDTYDATFWIAMAAITFPALWQMVECGFRDGTPGPNRHGPSPKGIADTSDVF